MSEGILKKAKSFSCPFCLGKFTAGRTLVRHMRNSCNKVDRREGSRVCGYCRVTIESWDSRSEATGLLLHISKHQKDSNLEDLIWTMPNFVSSPDLFDANGTDFNAAGYSKPEGAEPPYYEYSPKTTSDSHIWLYNS
jgi:hypothetical protein